MIGLTIDQSFYLNQNCICNIFSNIYAILSHNLATAIIFQLFLNCILYYSQSVAINLYGNENVYGNVENF